ncbi:hypothetical protein D3C75_362590 [compost metagenome]
MLECQFQAPEGAVAPQQHGAPAEIPLLWRHHAEQAGSEHPKDGDPLIDAHHTRVQTQHMLEEEGAQLEAESRRGQQAPGQTMAGNTAKKLDHLIDLTEKNSG